MRFSFPTLTPRFRLGLIAAVALGLAPGTLLRTAVDPDPEQAIITLTPLAERQGISGQLNVTGAWEITSTHPFFGGFSTLVDAGGEGLLAGTDRGWLLTIPIEAGEPDTAHSQYTDYATAAPGLFPLTDLEAMTRDPASGTLWTSYEGRNTIQREVLHGSTLVQAAEHTITRRSPPEMQYWSANSGAETIERFADGSFLILAEAPVGDEWPNRPGLLFPGDPIEQTDPVEFVIDTPPKFSPVDATALPDGRVLVLLRRVQVSIPAAFDAAIMLADPSTITEGGVWTGEIIARFEGPLYGENFEGIAYVPKGDGAGDIYVIADDNLSVFQRSLLVRLAWPPAQSAPAPAPLPSQAQ